MSVDPQLQASVSQLINAETTRRQEKHKQGHRSPLNPAAVHPPMTSFSST
jgi:hypothetical protein